MEKSVHTLDPEKVTPPAMFIRVMCSEALLDPPTLIVGRRKIMIKARTYAFLLNNDVNAPFSISMVSMRESCNKLRRVCLLFSSIAGPMLMNRY